MAGARQPIELVIAKGKKNLTKQEIEDRRAIEVKPCTDGIEAPDYLTPKQKKQFDVIAGQLQKIKVMGETDVDALARYISAQALYEATTKDLRAYLLEKPKRGDGEYLARMGVWAAGQNALAKLQNRYFTQAHTAASALGLTISSRCKLVVPAKEEEPPKTNKFSGFRKAAEGE